jgi:hypothetical protein
MDNERFIYHLEWIYCTAPSWTIFTLEPYRSCACGAGLAQLTAMIRLITRWSSYHGFDTTLTVVKIELRSFSSAEIQHFVTEDTRSD